MKIIGLALCAALLVMSNLTFAALAVTTNGFLDTSTNMEWLSPSKITSVSDYNTYVNIGWRIATTNDIEGLVTNSYSAYDQSLMDGYAAIAMPQDSWCTQASAVYCSYGWYKEIYSGEFLGYEIGYVGLMAEYTFNGTTYTITDPATVKQLSTGPGTLEIGTFFFQSTLGTYPLYGYQPSQYPSSQYPYSTFMVTPVPLPGAGYSFVSALSLLMIRMIRKRSTSKSVPG